MKLKNKKIYLIGIKGVGMTMLAQFLARQGNKISGSDISDEFLTDKILRREKIKVLSPFNPKNIPTDLDLIVHSSAFNEKNNSELAFIKKNSKEFSKIAKMSYAVCLGQVFNQYKGIAVCGSHGKTTTSAWLGYVLFKSGKNPNVLVGSNVPQLKGSAILGSSKNFIAEVDEYQNKLQYFSPFGVLLNNIEFDHPDYFKDEKHYQQVFIDFIKKIPKEGFLIANNSDEKVKEAMKEFSGELITYDASFSEETVETVNYLAHQIRIKNGYQYFLVNNLGEFSIQLLGRHNIYNALATIAAARRLGVTWVDIKKYLASFSGTERRAQILGRYQGAIVMDDYAHHPREIQSTLAGLKNHYPKKKIRIVFHPHTYTRTKALFNDFVKSFKEVDELIILDIYGSAREKQGGTSSQKLKIAIEKFNKTNKIKQVVKHIPAIPQTAQYLKKSLRSDEVVVLMGAGDVFRIGEIIFNKKTF